MHSWVNGVWEVSSSKSHMETGSCFSIYWMCTPLIPRHVALSVEEVTPSTGITIWTRADHGVVEVKAGEIARAWRRVLRPKDLFYARIGEAVRIGVNYEAEIVVF